jgi:hypothetical protein
MPMRAVDYGPHYPPPSPRRLLTIGELERLYGRDATVEVDAAPPPPAFPPVEQPVVEQRVIEQPIVERPFAERTTVEAPVLQESGFYQPSRYQPDLYQPRLYQQPGFEDQEEDIADVVPRRPSPFIPLTAAIVAGAAGLLVYGLYLRGYLDFPTLLSRAELAPTEDMQIERSSEVTSFPVRIEDHSADRNASPPEATAAAEAEAADRPSEQTLPTIEEPEPPSPAKAAPRAKPSTAPPRAKPQARSSSARTPAPAQVGRRRNTSVEDAATMEAIQRESARVSQDRAARERRIEQSLTGKQEPDSDPPGYIEADEPSK